MWRSGIEPDTTVVTYGYAAHLGYWLLRSCGHEQVRLTDGSRDRWVEAGHTRSTCVSTPTPTRYEFPAQRHFVASTEEVIACLADPARILRDVRSDAEYAGARFWPSGAPEANDRPGHAAQAWLALAALLGYENVRVCHDLHVDWGMDPVSSIEV